MVPSDPKLRQLSYWPAASGEARDGKWACSPTENSYPSLSHSLMHPCAAGGTNCCGHPSAPIITRFNSFFSAEHAVLIMAYEAWPICGDGTDMEIALTSRGQAFCTLYLSLEAEIEATIVLRKCICKFMDSRGKPAVF